MTLTGFFQLSATAQTPARYSSTPVAYSDQAPVSVAKQQYEAALQAQMLRAQIEQGAPDGFAQQAFEATRAYLEETAEKSYRPGLAEQNNRQRPSSRAYQNASVAYQAPVQDQRSVNRSSYPAAARQPMMGTPNQKTSMAPPVHVAPSSASRPPVPQRTTFANQNRSTARSGRSNPAALQDRIAGLFQGRKRTAEPSMAPPTRRFNEVAATLPTQQVQPRESRPNRVDLSDRKIPTIATGHAAQANQPTVSSYDQTASYQQPSKSPQPLFVPEPRRLPTKSQQIATRAPVIQNDMSAVSKAGMMEPSRPPQLAGPGERMPTDHFAQRQDRPIRMPVVSKTPTLQGSRGSYPSPKQVSVLMNQETDNSETEFPSNPNQGIDPANNFPSQGNTFPDRTVTPQDNRVRPLSTLPGRDGPTEDRGDPEETPQQQTGRTELPSLRDQSKQQDEIDQLMNEMQQKNQQDPEQDEARSKAPIESCDDFRQRLLGGSIRDIALDMSPPPSRIRDQFVAISRSWTDRLGNVIVTGTMVDLRRGYVIIDAGTGLQKIPYGKLSDADWSAVSEYWQIPELCSVGNTIAPTRSWIPQTVTWHASALCHKPLYFENRQLERYGHSHGPVLQPIHSTAHFFVSLFTLPYQTAIHPPTECRYALGYYRPGNCAPWLKDPVPISLDGIRRQALIATGLAFIP